MKKVPKNEVITDRQIDIVNYSRVHETKNKKAGQGYCWPYIDLGRLVSIQRFFYMNTNDIMLHMPNLFF